MQHQLLRCLLLQRAGLLVGVAGLRPCQACCLPVAAAPPLPQLLLLLLPKQELAAPHWPAASVQLALCAQRLVSQL
jgi:hypothetical protein